MARFADLINADLEGKNPTFHGAAAGPTVAPISKEEGGEKGKAAVLIVGWDSREAHMKTKEAGGEFLHLLA